MAKLSRKKGTTSQIFHVVIKDSTSTTGAGKTGLAYNTPSLVCRWLNAWNPLSASITLEDITTLGTYADPTSYAHMRFKEVSNADPSKGLYEIHVHNNWMNLNGGNLIIMLAGATGMADCQLEVDLQADTNVTHISGTAQTARDIGASVLLSSGTGTGQVSLSSGLVTLAGVTHTGAVIPTVTAVTNDVGITQTAADKAWSTATRALTDKAGFALSAAGVQAIWDALTSALTTAGSVGKKLADWVLGSDSKVLLSSNAQTGVTIPTVTTLTGHTPQTGDSYALANGANGFVALKSDTAAILTDTGTTLDTKINNIQGATFDTATDSLEALRNRGDAAWTTATGFSTHAAADVWAVAARTLTSSSGIKKNTVLNNFEFFMRDSADHVTGKTGLTVTATRSIDGGVFAACANAVAEVSNGIYKLNLAASDLNGDVVTFKFSGTGADTTVLTVKTEA